MPKFITLEEWARRTYAEGGPNINTLRRWAREARILPRPEKHGRQYYVVPEAVYASPYARSRLVDRLRGDNARGRR